MLDYLYLGLYKLFRVILKVLPRSIVKKIMYGMAWFAYNISSKHRQIIHRNLKIVYGETMDEKAKRSIGIAAFMNLIDTIFGIMQRDGMRKEDVITPVSFEGSDILKKYQEEGKNFILVTGHYGNWELLSQSIAIKFDLSLVGVGRKIDSDVMDDVLKKNRERFNVEMVYKKGAMKGCIKAISQGKTIGILTDQSINPNQSIEVVFFGVKATHTPLASILSRKFGLDMIPAFISTDDYVNYKVKIYEPIKAIKTDDHEDDLATLTQAQADAMQLVIEENPKQWFWMHRRWK